MELHCEGPCNQTKHLDQFSKRTRGDGVNWCIACQSWALAQEPGTTPFAAPNQLHDVLEQQTEIDIALPPEGHFGASAYDDEDDEADEPLAPVTDPALFAGPLDANSSSSSFVAASEAATRSQNLRLPPHILRTQYPGSSDSSSDASFPLCLDDGQQTVPSHGLGNITEGAHSMAAFRLDEERISQPPRRNQDTRAAGSARRGGLFQNHPGHPSDISENSWYGKSLRVHLQGANEVPNTLNAARQLDARNRGSGRGSSRGRARAGLPAASNSRGRPQNANNAFSEISENSIPESIRIKTSRVPQANAGGFSQGQPRFLHRGSQDLVTAPASSSRTGGVRFDADTVADEDEF
ncbi:hypothetical protein SODALDRAFT_319748 [Sodiomyces alkalinus F11]|uniref:Stc1 domain-containing protein n=1 Tax=Sodiomyces alkalinus (strain CBS 110278 / VKM F-3762 / F11) TaxID=1314773 RepID=A0A3N2Q920_SODAK|nr:hypothetical protein SODALDRAFT_319748 [Sodiomyces alkalinus F11]ROT43252.1 hypothetical protein SODALDRAFT_319748 [Sodiomyces alkalinus F11]